MSWKIAYPNMEPYKPINQNINLWITELNKKPDYGMGHFRLIPCDTKWGNY